MNKYQTWRWRGFDIGYQHYGEKGSAVVFVHGFGANSGHWRKNLPVLSKNYRCYAIDLLGFGQSSKPVPGKPLNYTFETWSQQVIDFCREVVKSPVYLVGNSIGCIVTMQMAVDSPELVLGIASLNCSLRLLHETKRQTLPWYKNWGSQVMQNILTNPTIGNFFYRQIAKPKVIKNLLSQAYQNKEAIVEELIDLIYQPSQDEGAAAVFLAFTSYSQGPLAEDLLPLISCPVTFLWGNKDPWEAIALGRELSKYPCVQDFIELENLGHCPQDEAPNIVNSQLETWLMKLEN